MNSLNPSPARTDWSSYYRVVSPTARLTRRYTTREIIKALSLHRFPVAGARILEFGGANSCFLDSIVNQFCPASYDIADTSEYGLSLLRDRVPNGCVLTLHNQDVLSPSSLLTRKFDLVYSVGLIEHFDREDTVRAIRNHVMSAIPGGLVLISFPCPTLLYRIARRFLEAAQLWRFPDERPIFPSEVLDSLKGCGEILFQKTLWPLVLTQYLILLRTAKDSA